MPTLSNHELMELMKQGFELHKKIGFYGHYYLLYNNQTEETIFNVRKKINVKKFKRSLNIGSESIEIFTIN